MNGKRLSSCCKCGKKGEAIHEMGKCPLLFTERQVTRPVTPMSTAAAQRAPSVVFKKPWEK